MRKNRHVAAKPAATQKPVTAEQGALPEQPAPVAQSEPSPVKIENNQLISMLSMLHAAMGRGEDTVSVDPLTMEMLLVEVMLSRMNGAQSVTSNLELVAQ